MVLAVSVTLGAEETVQPAEEVTRLLCALGRGEGEAFDRLLPVVYEQLHRLANRQLRRERPGHTLQTTALVHEAYLSLVRERDRKWENRAHFMQAAAIAMRRILVKHAEKRSAQKRGGSWKRVPLDAALDAFEERAIDVVALDAALDRMTRFDPEKRRIVELRFFAGLTMQEIAELLDVSTRTVERSWQLARAWLRTELERV